MCIRDRIPTVHLGPAAHQMEKRGVETFLGNLNRDIRAANSLMQSIRSAIRGLQRWIADLNEKKQLLLDALEKAKEPTLSDLLVDYFNLRNEQRSDWSGKAKLKCTVRDFEEIRQAVDYLKAHSLNTIEDLDTAISNPVSYTHLALAAGGGFYFYHQQMQKKKAEKEALDPDANYTEDKGDFEIPTEDELEDTGEEDTEPI